MTILPFSEGTNTLDRRIITYASNSIDTSAIDPFRQGIELTQDKHFQQGIAKIWSGIEGHIVDCSEIGQRDDDIFPETTYYEEIARFDPVLYLSDYYSQQVIVIDSAVNVNENGFDGIIEPLPIRRVVSFTSIDVPFEARSVKGNLESGNHDPFRNADQVVTEVRFSEKAIGTHSYEDNVDMTGRVPTNLGFWPTISTKIGSFDDSQHKDGVMLPVFVNDRMKESLKSMNPATENYLPQDFLSSAASLHYSSDYYVPRSFEIYDPSALQLTGWWKDFSGAPWNGSTSVGNSHLHMLSSGGTAPTSGETLNSLATADFSSSSSQSLVDSSININCYISLSSYSHVLLVKPRQAAAPTAGIYDNPSLVGDNSGNFGIVFSTSGIAVHHYSSPTYYVTEWLPADSGSWHFVAVTYDGSTLTLYVDGRSTTVKSVPSLSAPTELRIGKGYTTNYADILLAELMISKNIFSKNTLEDVRRRYLNLRYNLPL